MTFSKTLIIALGINIAFSSVLCASFQEEHKEKNKKVKFSTDQMKKVSALIKRRQKVAEVPSEPKGCREAFPIKINHFNKENKEIREILAE